jgi:KUP system potassium uptake protein
VPLNIPKLAARDVASRRPSASDWAPPARAVDTRGTTSCHEAMERTERRKLLPLAIGAIGIVYGDIGTSPLYTVKQIFDPATGIPLDGPHLVGTASVIFWALMLVVTLKYVVVVLRADNRGEGGIMALTALAAHAAGPKLRHPGVLLLLGLFGAGLFYGDSVITPAISVLSAIEGLEIATPLFKPYILPISVGVLVGLFTVQRYGTAAVGRFFGPVMIAWFLVLAVTGLAQIVQGPGILAALNPLHAWHFIAERGWRLFAAVGAIVLAMTGAEALYADMGHFGKRPIRAAWLVLVYPALTLNYFGQCAMLGREPAAIANPFFHLFPPPLLIPAVVLAGVATVIASQAVISGAYSMTRQAMQLGFLPRMQVAFTSAREMGQIYMPQVNRVLLVAVLAATIGFGSSTALAWAYGIAVTMTMLITSLLTFFVARHAWGFPLGVVVVGAGVFVAVDALLVASCSIKVVEGGWFPLVLGLAIFSVMSTWKRGRALVTRSISDNDPELLPFVTMIGEEESLARVPRTAIYPIAVMDKVPQALLHNLKHNAVLHEQNVILTVVFHDVPWIPFAQRVEVRPLAKMFWRVVVNYGFKNTPDVPLALELCKAQGLELDPMRVSYFLSRETIVATKSVPGMALWRERLFALMARNGGTVADFFKLPNNSVIELGARVQI